MGYDETVTQRCFHEVFDALIDERCLAQFAFKKEGTEHILVEFDWKNTRTYCNRYDTPVITVLSILLHRFVALCQWNDVEALFGCLA